MDYLGILEDHLDFIERFYDAAAEPFKTTLRKIEAGEEPFVPKYAPGDHNGPEYLQEWMEANKCLGVLGSCALGFAQKGLHDYLRAFTEREGGLGNEGPKSRSWFDRHCRFLEEHTQFSWTKSPVAKDQLEQVVLSRNDIVHDPMIDRTQPPQSEEHFRKYPVPRFADGWYIEAMSGEDGKPQSPLFLSVTCEKLAAATADVRQFCVFVENQRTKW
jgi:hypothetical protein